MTDEDADGETVEGEGRNFKSKKKSILFKEEGKVNKNY